MKKQQKNFEPIKEKKNEKMNTKDKISAGVGAIAGSLLLPGKGLFSLACKAAFGGAAQTFVVPAVRSLFKTPKAAEMYEQKEKEPDLPREPLIKIKPLPLVFQSEKRKVFQSEHDPEHRLEVIKMDPQWEQFVETWCYPHGPFAIHLTVQNPGAEKIPLYISKEWKQVIDNVSSDITEYTPLPVTDDPSGWYVMTLVEKPPGSIDNVFIFETVP